MGVGDAPTRLFLEPNIIICLAASDKATLNGDVLCLNDYAAVDTLGIDRRTILVNNKITIAVDIDPVGSQRHSRVPPASISAVRIAAGAGFDNAVLLGAGTAAVAS